MPEPSFDVVVVGSGPGGYVAAIRASQLGLRTAVVERSYLGGICLNWGCIPTKALLRSADVYETLQHAPSFGLSAGSVGFDTKAVVERSRRVAQRLNSGVAYLLKKNKVAVIWGDARLPAPGRVEVSAAAAAPAGALGPGSYEARNIIVATGARPRVLPGIEPDKALIWTYFEAMVPPSMPKSLLVIGSGAIGIEFASFFASFGAAVTVVEVLPQILPAEDAEIAAFARKALERRGISIITGAKVKELGKRSDGLAATIEDSKGVTRTLAVERAISAVGVTGNIEKLGLEGLGVKTERGTIVVDGYGRTNIAGVFAIGDVAGPPMLAHKAEHEGVVCVEAIKGLKPHAIDKQKIPGCTYCTPQIASVGLTESAARAQGLHIRVGRFPFIGNGKAIALGEDQGLVKTIFDADSGQLIGLAAMEHSCHKCGDQVEDGVAFCAHCGAPQIRVVMEEPESGPPVLGALSPQTILRSAGVAVDRSGPSQAIYWAQGLPAAAMAGLVAGFGMMFIGLFGLWMLAAGFLSVVFYRQRTRGGRLFPRAGARLGAVSGLVGFAIFAGVTVPTGLFRSMMLEMIRKYASQRSDPQLQALTERWLEILKTPEGLTAWLVALFFFLIIASALGGALAGAFLSRRRPQGPSFPS